MSVDRADQALITLRWVLAHRVRAALPDIILSLPSGGGAFPEIRQRCYQNDVERFEQLPPEVMLWKRPILEAEIWPTRWCPGAQLFIIRGEGGAIRRIPCGPRMEPVLFEHIAQALTRRARDWPK